MDLFKWKQDYSVKINIIDEQHKKLVDLLNDIFKAMKSGEGNEVVEKILRQLINYTKKHFSTEEELMKKHGYSDYSTHKNEHDNLTKRVVQLHSDLQKGNTHLSVRVGFFLRDWLSNHILKVDKQYTSFLNSKGVK